MPKKLKLPPDETVQVSLGIQLLDYEEAEAMANQTWAGAEEILDSVDLSKHPSSAAVMRGLLERGWESDSVTGLLLGIWMKKNATAGEIAKDLLSVEPIHRRSITALYGADSSRDVVQYSIDGEGSLVQHRYSRKAATLPDIKLYSA